MSDSFENYVKSLESMVLGSSQQQQQQPPQMPIQVQPVNISNLQNLINKSIGAPVVTTTSPVSAQPKYEGKKLTFMLVSTHCNQVTGYSKVSYNLIKQLSQIPWLNVVHYGFQRLANKTVEGREYPSNIKVIDAVSLEQPLKQGFGFEQLPAEISRVKPNIVMIYNDMAVINQFMEGIKKSGIPRNFQTWFYVDQVYNYQMGMYLDVINREADRVFAFTQGWKDCLKDQGIHRPIDVIAHGFDEKVFYPIPKTLARKKMGLPDDLFLFLSVNRNQPRKRLDILIMAFAELVVKNPTKPIALLCICDKGEKGGWILFEIFMRELKKYKVPIERFSNRLMISTRDMEFKDEDINNFYNAADCCVSTADGEGFGLCTFESMGVGIPQVVPAIGGYKEFCNDSNSILVKPKHRYYLPLVHCPVGGEAEACDPHDICIGMETYINDSELRSKHGVAAKETVLKYTWESVVKNFVRRLKTAHEDCDE